MAPRKNPQENSFNFLAEVIEKMIDAQISNAESLSSIRDGMTSVNESIKEILGHFSNGFRSEIKEHVTNELERHRESMIKVHEEITQREKELSSSNEEKFEAIQNKINTTDERVKQLQELFRRPGLWIKIFVAFVIALGSISAGLLTLDKVIESNAVTHVAHEQIIQELNKKELGKTNPTTQSAHKE